MGCIPPVLLTGNKRFCLLASLKEPWDLWFGEAAENCTMPHCYSTNRKDTSTARECHVLGQDHVLDHCAHSILICPDPKLSSLCGKATEFVALRLRAWVSKLQPVGQNLACFALIIPGRPNSGLAPTRQLTRLTESWASH